PAPIPIRRRDRGEQRFAPAAGEFALLMSLLYALVGELPTEEVRSDVRPRPGPLRKRQEGRLCTLPVLDEPAPRSRHVDARTTALRLAPSQNFPGRHSRNEDAPRLVEMTLSRTLLERWHCRRAAEHLGQAPAYRVPVLAAGDGEVIDLGARCGNPVPRGTCPPYYLGGRTGGRRTVLARAAGAARARCTIRLRLRADSIRPLRR